MHRSQPMPQIDYGKQQKGIRKYLKQPDRKRVYDLGQLRTRRKVRLDSSSNKRSEQTSVRLGREQHSGSQAAPIRNR